MCNPSSRRQTRALCRMWAAAVLAGAACGAASFGQATGRALFVANHGNLEGSVSAMAVQPDGALVLLNRVITGTRPTTQDPCAGCNPYEIAISPNGRYLATVHASGPAVDEQITIFEVAPAGTIAQIAAFLKPGTPMDVVWISDELLAATHGDTNPYQLRVYRFDRGALTLTQVELEPVGSFSTYLAVHPSRRYLYINDSGSVRQVLAYRIEAGGLLTLIDTEYTGSYYALELAISPDGTKLYAAGGITEVELGYDIAPDGTLAPMPGSPFPSVNGLAVSNVAVSADGSHLLAGHGTDGTVRTLAIDPGTGNLTYTGNSFQTSPYRSLRDIQALHNLFFVSDDYYKGVYSFTLNPANGSFTQNGALVLTGGVGTRAMAVWAGGRKGDLNCDGVVNFDDINPFVLALSDPAGYAAAYPTCPIMNADINNDGVVDFDDINPFVALLTNP
ncbi:MAG: beta-propeller fold lactonase family protein [Planctomycetota bacterium]